MASATQVSTLERVRLLKTLPALRDLPHADLAVLAQQARERVYPRGSVVVAAQRRATVHLIVDGTLRVRRASADLGTRGPGEGLGLLELLARAPQGIQAIAESDLLALALDEESFFDVLEDNFSILYHLLGDVCRSRIEQLTKRAPDREPLSAHWHKSTTKDLDLADRVLFLRRLLPFAQGNVAALVDIARHLSERRARAGEALWGTGEKTAGSFLLIVSGEVSGTLPSGDRLSFATMTMPGSLEAMAALPRWFDATATTDVHALRMDSELLLDVFDDNEDMAIGYLSMIARQALEARDLG